MQRAQVAELANEPRGALGAGENDRAEVADVVVAEAVDDYGEAVVGVNEPGDKAEGRKRRVVGIRGIVDPEDTEDGNGAAKERRRCAGWKRR